MLTQVKTNETRHEIMQRVEEETVALAIQEGYLDPRKDDKLNKTVEFEDLGGRLIRRFILGFGYVGTEKFKNSSGSKTQVRHEEIDIEHCEKVLLPHFEKDGLKYPPFTSTAGIFEQIDSGHHRSYTYNLWKSGQPMPRFLIGEPCYINDDGSLTRVPNTSFWEIASRISPNQPDPIKPTTIEDAALQLTNLFEVDKSFAGLNPSGEWFKGGKADTAFNAVMNWVYPELFLHPSTRGKILAKCRKSSKGKKTLTPAIVSSELNRLGWGHNSITKNGKKIERKTLLDSCSNDGTAYVGVCDDNGRNMTSKITYDLFDRLCSPDPFTFREVNLVCKIYGGASNITELNKKRRTFVGNIEVEVGKLAIARNKNDLHKCCPQIKRLWFPTQLRDGSDQGLMFVWNGRTCKFDQQ